MKKSKLLLLALLITPVFVIGLTASHQPKAAALTSFNYTDHLMDDDVFRASGTMSADSIQSFLQSKGSGLANFHDVYVCGHTTDTHFSYYNTYYNCTVAVADGSGGTYYQTPSLLASQLIYDSSQAYGINPQAIIATLQKEQSLITTPNPTSSQLNYAMGYGCPDSGGCGTTGFANQVDNGTWQLRVNFERINGNTWWGMSPSTYPCLNGAAPTGTNSTGKNLNFYYPGLMTGNDVTFYDGYGNAYTHFVIPNASTASLYCYTPHVYPGSSQQYYSGTKNFVYYFNLWFVPYAWLQSSRSVFVDASRTIPYTLDSNTTSLAPGTKVYLRVKAQNNGYETWDPSVVHLGTTAPQDRCSSFSDASWLSCGRIRMVESSVAPGAQATFDFSDTAPQTTGTYRECFNVVADGITWLNNQNTCFTLDVVPRQPIIQTKATLQPGDSLATNDYLLSPETHCALVLQPDGNLVLYNDFVARWSDYGYGTKTSALIMQGDGNLVAYDTAGKAIWASNTNGNPNAYATLQSDGNLVVYSSTNTALWASNTSTYPDHSNHVNGSLGAEQSLYVGQSLTADTGKYRLVMQGDGNLVLYSPTRPLWASNTSGKPAYRLVMQGDGNLVLYDKAGRPLWASNTAGRGRSGLYIQGDGNMVMYAANGATWASNTAGAQ